MSLPAAMRTQAAACGALGSPFMARLLTVLADHWPATSALAMRCNDWSGDIGPSGASLPLRIAGTRITAPENDRGSHFGKLGVIDVPGSNLRGCHVGVNDFRCSDRVRRHLGIRYLIVTDLGRGHIRVDNLVCPNDAISHFRLRDSLIGKLCRCD